MKIGYLGMGIMGSGMAENLLAAGHDVIVWNRSPGKCDAVIEKGATEASSVGDAVDGCDIACICVTNGDIVAELCLGDQGILSAMTPPKTVVDFSTIAPAQAKEIGAALAEKGIAFLDAPVSGGDVGAKNGTLSVMVGGTPEAFEHAAPVFSAVGKSTVHTGECGNGQMTKAINQVVVAINIAAMSEGLTLAKATGLDPQTTLDVIRGGAAGSWALDNYAPRILQGDLAPGFHARNQLKDLRISLAEADAADVALPVSHLVKELYLALVSGGDGELGNHGLIRLYERVGS